MERGFRSRLSGHSLRNRWSLALALGTGFVLSFALPAQAVTDTLDQAQPLTMGLESVGQMAQTFTAGITGQLDRVSLPTDTGFAAGTVQIQTVSGTFPAGTVLGTTSFSASYLCCHRYHDYTFTPTIPMTAGAHYAIVVKVLKGHMSWYTSDGVDAYAGGSLYLGCLNCGWGIDPIYGGDYAFQTWVIPGNAPPVNHAPTVAADNATVNVKEGTVPVNTGTFLDTDGDTVTVTASAGTVNQNGSSGGTWSWTQPASDEPSTQTVTIKADDGKGLTSTATFTTTSAGVAPTVSISRGSAGPSAAALSTAASASAPEGTPVNLNGTANSPSAEDTAAGFAYSWNVTKDGALFGTGSAAAFSFTPNDEGTYVATFTAKDDGGLSASTSMTFVGANVAPSAKITSIGWTSQLGLTPNQQVNFAGSFTDPGALDTHTEVWKFGDGASSNGTSASHSYSAAGTYTVTFNVTDDDNGAGQATATVTVLTPQQALSSIGAYIQNLKSLNAGQKNSLMAKIDAANASIARGNATAATNQLNALLNECQADLNSGRMTSTDIVTIRDEVHAVQAALGTYNRFLEWWPLGA